MLWQKQGLVGVVAPPCFPRRVGSSALGTKLQPEAMTSSQYQACPEREAHGGSMVGGGDLKSGHTCLSGTTGPEPRGIRDRGPFQP